MKRSDYTKFVEHVKKLINDVKYHSELGYISEIGELADAYKKVIYKNEKLDSENVLEELGDILFYLISYISKHNLPCAPSGFLDTPIEISKSTSTIDAIIQLANAPLRENGLSIRMIQKYLSTVVYLCGFTYEEVMAHNVKKLNERYPSGEFTIDDAIKRNDKKVKPKRKSRAKKK